MNTEFKRNRMKRRKAEKEMLQMQHIIFYTGDGILTIFPFAPDHQMLN